MAQQFYQLLKLCTPEDTISLILVKGSERLAYTYKQAVFYDDYINARSAHDSKIYHLNVELIRANGSVIEFYVFNPKFDGEFSL